MASKIKKDAVNAISNLKSYLCKDRLALDLIRRVSLYVTELRVAASESKSKHADQDKIIQSQKLLIDSLSTGNSELKQLVDTERNLRIQADSAKAIQKERLNRMKAIIDGTPESIAEEKELISLSHIFIQLKKAMPKPPKPVYEITDRVGSSGTCFVFHLRDFLPKGRAPTLDELATIGRFVICVHLGFCEIVGFTGMELANKQKLDGDNRDVRRFRDWINWMASQWLESTGSDKDTANEKVMAGMDMDADSDSLLRYKWLTSGRHSEI